MTAKTCSITVLLAATLAATCPAQEAEKPAQASAPVMATVNGKPVYMAALIDELLQGPGFSYAQKLVREEVVRQEMVKNNMQLTEEDVNAEADRILRMMVPGVKDLAQRKNVLKKILTDKQVSYSQWLRSAGLLASLRKLAEPKVKITDEMIRTQFGRMYGEHRIARHIEVDSLSEAQKVLAELKAGKDFGRLAYNKSKANTWSEDGRLPPIGPKTQGVPPAIIQAVNALEKPGDVSDPMQVGAKFHIIKLDKIVPPDNVKLEDVKAKVTEVVTEMQLQDHQRKILRDLETKAKVRYVNPVLKKCAAQGKQQ